MEKFPVLKRRKGEQRILKGEIINIYCTCRLPDDKTGMVCCDNCEEWFHFHCVDVTPNQEFQKEWYCPNCSNVMIKIIIT